jgi:hypothetical protein
MFGSCGAADQGEVEEAQIGEESVDRLKLCGNVNMLY